MIVDMYAARMMVTAVLLCRASLGAAGTEAVRNDRVVVRDETIGTGETVTWSGGHPSEVVYLTDGALEIAGVSTRVKRGDAVFETAKSRVVKNTGASDVHFARIEFLGSGLAETWGRTGISPNYKLLFENQYARLYDIRIPAGTKEPQHTHHDRVVVCLSGAHLKHLMPDGREEPSDLKTGEIGWRRGATHIGQNLGETDLWVIAVEPK
jgi:hypothetical protein